MPVANSRNEGESGRSIEMGDASELLRLANALHYIPRHPRERKRQMLHGLAKLVEANSGICIVAHRKQEMEPILVTLSQVGRSEKSRSSSQRRGKPRSTAAPSAAAPSGGGDSLTALTTDVMYQGKPIHDGVFGDRAVLFSTLSLDHKEMLAGVALARRAGSDQGRFTSREIDLVHLFHTEMRWVYALDLPLASPEVLSLSHRPQETLQYLLAGNSEKEIATHLDLSLNTVHHYVKRLYRHFRVSSRSELLARWVKK